MKTTGCLFAALVIFVTAPIAAFAQVGEFGTVLEFDTELLSLDLTGGPYPIPLAADPGNVLGDSIDGYGFVDSEVTITLSSQRAGTPGPRSFGKAFAFQEQLPALNAGQQDPIDPEALNGQQFFVDSFFDVFFDITVTDVDPRAGRDYAGQADGASFFLEDNNAGPEDPVRSFHIGTFDKDAPNFGLLPPPEADPYIGEFEVEIPLGGDINQNGEDDKIKFTIASHSAGDENRQFIVLPDGTVIDEFDSAAFLAGAIVDESTDPPFTIGVNLGTPGFPLPAFTGPGAFTGPTTATSTLLNPVVGAVVPEPATFAPALIALLGFTFFCRHRRSR